MAATSIYGFGNTLIPGSNESYTILHRIKEFVPDSKITLSVNSHFHTGENMLHGWFVKFPPTTPTSLVPFTSNMFEGITVVETFADESSILDLLKNKKQVLADMREIVDKYLSTNNNNRASWYRCRPQRTLPLQKTSTWRVVMRQENLARYTTVGAAGDSVRVSDDAPFDLIPDDTVPNYIDSASWYVAIFLTRENAVF
jgi:hypothetical protein